MCVVCVTVGLYVASQIGLGITKNIEKNKLEQNLKKWEEVEKKRQQK